MRVKKTASAANMVKLQTAQRVSDREALGPMLVRTSKKKSTARGYSQAAASKMVAAVEALVEAHEFGKWTPREWVALFCWTYEAIYGVDCIGEVRGEWKVAAASASRMLVQEFEGDADSFFQYLAWVSAREREREEWRRKNQKPGGRIDWRAVFMRKRWLSEYRLDRARLDGVQ